MNSNKSSVKILLTGILSAAVLLNPVSAEAKEIAGIAIPETEASACIMKDTADPNGEESTPFDFRSEMEKMTDDSYSEYMNSEVERLAEKTETVNGTVTYTFIPCEDTDDIENSETYRIVQGVCSWDGTVLTKSAGRINGPSGQETYYNLDMSGVLNIMAGLGYTDPYWVRSDGVKMIGNYIMIAADLSRRPKGTIVETSLGLGLVCDTGCLSSDQSDIAVEW